MNRALLLIGLLGALRRSEIVALDVDAVEVTEDGLVIALRSSKTDPEGAGDLVGVPRRADQEVCPVRALQAWLELAGIEAGPIWLPVDRWGHVRQGRRMTDRQVARIVQRACRLVGQDPARYAAHSLRSGFATAAAEADVSEREIMEHGRWKSVQVARRYIRRGGLFRGNAAGRLAL